MTDHGMAADRALTAEEDKTIVGLSRQQLREIDNALLENTMQHWQKVAKVVATTMQTRPVYSRGLPDVFFSQRIQKLAAEGSLEARGPLAHMRCSEVRLKTSPLDHPNDSVIDD